MNNIFHLDLDAFFASVEEVINPVYKNKPLVVCGRTTKSVVSSANYAARKLGIHSAMPLFEAKNLYKGLIIVPGHYHLYDDYSQKFFNILRTQYTNYIEQCSIDECFLDAKDIIQNYKDEKNLALRIQKDVYEQLGISVSIGISYNKFLAKMATDLNKPNGITIIDKTNIEKILWPLDITKMHMIGKSSAKELKENGINTIGDLVNIQNINLLKDILHKNWIIHVEHAKGNGSTQLDLSYNVPKSVSTSHTLLNPSNDLTEIQNYMKYMTREVIEKLNSYSLMGRTISINYKTIDRRLYTKNITIPKHINNYEQMYHHVLQLLDLCYRGEEWRLIGVGIGNLISCESLEINLFNYQLKKENAYMKIIDQVNTKLKKDVLFIAKDALNEN